MSLEIDFTKNVQHIEANRLVQLARIEKEITSTENDIARCHFPRDKPKHTDLVRQLNRLKDEQTRYKENKDMVQFLLKVSPTIQEYNTDGFHQPSSSSASAGSSHKGTLYERYKLLAEGRSLFSVANNSLLSSSVPETFLTSAAASTSNANGSGGGVSSSTLELIQQQQTKLEIYSCAGVCPNYEVCRGVLQVRAEEGKQLCENCGTTLSYLEPTGNSMYGTDIDYQNTNHAFEYQLEGHFKEWLLQIQGIGTVPHKVYSVVYQECKNLKPSQITIQRVKRILKRNKLTKTSNKVIGIVYLLTGKKPKQFTEEQMQIMCEMFRMIQQPYERHKKNRQNFLSYPFVLRKFIRMLRYDISWLKDLPLLKDATHLATHEQIWTNICTDLDWDWKQYREM